MKKQNKINSLKSNRPALRWALDYDYLDQLSPEELEWLRGFTHDHYDNGEPGERRSANYKNSVDLCTVGERSALPAEPPYHGSPEDAIIRAVDARAASPSPIRPRRPKVKLTKRKR